MRLCTSATESDVRRGKNLLRNALVSHLDGESLSLLGRGGGHPGSDSPSVATIPNQDWKGNLEGYIVPHYPSHRGLELQRWVDGPRQQPVTTVTGGCRSEGCDLGSDQGLGVSWSLGVCPMAQNGLGGPESLPSLPLQAPLLCVRTLDVVS